MKIGIITYHRAHNYGAVLQCYALQQAIRLLGHQVEVIDYRQPYIEYYYKLCNWRGFISRCIHPFRFLRFIRTEIPSHKRISAFFEEFRQQKLMLSRPCKTEIPTDYDAYVIGSDQLWSLNCLGWKLEPFYFGDFAHKKESSVIGYAISSNEKSIKYLGFEKLTSLLSHFDSISMRESKLADLVHCMTNKDIHVDIDPTLLLGIEEWKKLCNDNWKDKNYVLVYYVKRGFGKFAHDRLLAQAKELAKNNNSEIIDLSNKDFSVVDFVSAFRYANYVVTTSFHATVFSIIFERNFYSMKLHDGHDERYVNLLKALGIENRLIDMDSKIFMAEESINYQRVQSLLNEIRKPSLDYLKTNLCNQ